MRILLQRVSSASVRVRDQELARIGHGLLLLVGVGKQDGFGEYDRLAEKVANLRVFEDDDGKMNRSLLDVGGQMLVVSQFTLFGDCKKGRRPSFVDAAPPELAERLYDQFVATVRGHGVTVGTGRFRTHMEVSLTNDGPVTLIVESP